MIDLCQALQSQSTSQFPSDRTSNETNTILAKTSPKDRHLRKEKGEINEEKTFMVLEYSIQSSHEYSYATDHTTPSSVAGFFRGQ
jgi:hypothetical protein